MLPGKVFGKKSLGGDMHSKERLLVYYVLYVKLIQIFAYAKICK